MKQERKSTLLNRTRTNRSGKRNLDLIFDIAVRIWQLNKTMIREHQDSGDLEGKRSWRQLERLISEIEHSGIVIQDKTGDRYDTGMSVKVIASEPRGDLHEEIILETISPTIMCKGNIARFGEIVVGVPAVSSQNKNKQGDEI